jgi:hypothetical protein
MCPQTANSGLGVDDCGRAKAALLGVKGKRLTYRRADYKN